MEVDTQSVGDPRKPWTRPELIDLNSRLGEVEGVPGVASDALDGSAIS
jgi:hypothetical protein